MILKPFDPVTEALTIAGLAKPSTEKKKQNLTKLQETLNDRGASIDAAAAALGRLLINAEEATILRAIDLTFRAHGVLKEAEKPTMPNIHISIHGKEQRDLTQLITPQIVNVIPEEMIPEGSEIEL